MKEEPNPVSHNLMFSISMAKSSFIDLCDFSDEDNPSLPDMVVLLWVNSQPIKEQALPFDLPQMAPFTILSIH